MNADAYRNASLVEKELFGLLIALQKDVDYIKKIAQRLEKELPDEEE